MKKHFVEKALTQALQLKPDEDLEDNYLRTVTFLAEKYDSYQQFYPGFRFLESLTNWLYQFKTPAEARTAFEFVRKRLVFISEEQIRLLVDSVYSLKICPFILEDVLKEKQRPRYKLREAKGSSEFSEGLNRSLFLGLSDGARTDVFRRFNPMLQNDQVWLTYAFNEDKIEDFKKHLANLPSEKQTFKYIWLMDDFSASGTSFIRKDNGKWKGKIPKTIRRMQDNGEELFAPQAKICVLLYIASDTAKKYFELQISQYWEENKEISQKFDKPEIFVVQTLNEDIQLDSRNKADEAIIDLIQSDDYYDPKLFDDHSKVGKTTDVKFGYANGRLPVVLSHNTPNNSVSILWSFETATFIGLFPRVSRH